MDVKYTGDLYIRLLKISDNGKFVYDPIWTVNSIPPTQEDLDMNREFKPGYKSGSVTLEHYFRGVNRDAFAVVSRASQRANQGQDVDFEHLLD